LKSLARPGFTSGGSRSLPRAGEFGISGKPCYNSVLEDLLAFLHVGPRSAYVAQVNTEWLAPTGEFHRFEVRY
jgi:hypothetical protein